MAAYVLGSKKLYTLYLTAYICHLKNVDGKVITWKEKEYTSAPRVPVSRVTFGRAIATGMGSVSGEIGTRHHTGKLTVVRV